MTTVRRVKASQFAEVFAKDMATLRARLVEATHETASTGAKLVAQNAPHAFGEVADGVVPIELPSGAKIRATAPHSAAVEVGSRPHMPPLAPLVRWVKLRGMQGLQRGARGAPRAVARMIRREGSKTATPIDAAEQVAWAIAMGIKKRGTRPTWFVRRSLPAIRAILGAHVRSQLSRAL